MEDKAKNPLGTEKINSLIAKFAIPSIIAMLVSALYNIVDQIFIGRYVGMLGNAATNVSFPLNTICIAIALLCGIGGAANFNLSLGRGDKDKAEKYAGNTISMMFILGIIVFVLVSLFLEPLMIAFGATDKVLDYALTYTRITSIGFIFLILTTGGSNLIRADGSPTYSMICTLTGAIINVVLDAIFVTQLDMGIAGAAWATVIGQVVSAIMVIVHLVNFRTLHISLLSLKPSWRYCKNIISLGATPSINQIAMMVVQIVMNNVLTYIGSLSHYGSDIPLACAGIIAKVNMVFFSFVIGLSQGMQPISSFNYGAKNYQRVEDTYKKSIKVATIMAIIAFLCFQLIPRQIISIFGSGSEEYFLFAEKYFRIFLFFTFLNGLQPITSTFFTTIGKPKKGIFLSLTRQVIFLLPLLIILPMIFGIDGIMFSAPIADLIAAVLSVLFARREFKNMNMLMKECYF